MDKPRSALEIIAKKRRPVSVFLNEFESHFALLQLYSIFETSRSNRMMAAILTLLMLLDQED